MVDQRPQHVGDADVRLVAECREAGEALAEAARARHHLFAEATALTDEGDVPGGDVEQGHRIQPGGRVGDAEAVGPDQQAARGPDARHRRLLAGQTLGAEFTEPGRHDAQRFRPDGEGVLHGVVEAGGRDGDEDEVDRGADLS